MVGASPSLDMVGCYGSAESLDQMGSDARFAASARIHLVGRATLC